MWRSLGQFTLTDKWQHTKPSDGLLFRVRHLSVTDTRGTIAQAVVEGGILHLFEKQRIVSRDQPDLFAFKSPIKPGDRRIAIKTDYFTTPWRVAIDVYEGSPVPDYLSIFNAHSSALNPHPQYLSAEVLYGALSGMVKDSDLAAALADRVTDADLAAALADRVTDADLATAITNFVSSSQLAEAIADKPSEIILTTTTTGNTVTEMNSPRRVTLKPNSMTGYEIHLTAQTMNNSGSPENIYWIGSGALTRGATAASTVLQTQTAVRKSSSGIGSGWNPDLTADTVNGGLKIRVPGAASRTIKWVAHVRLFEVS